MPAVRRATTTSSQTRRVMQFHILAVLGPLAGGLRSPTRVLRATLPGVDSENPQDAIQVVAGARRDPCAGALGVKVDAIWQRRVRGM